MAASDSGYGARAAPLPPSVSDMYRVATPAALLLLLGVQAQASPFHVIENGTAEDTPSIVRLEPAETITIVGAPSDDRAATTDREMIPISPSIIAIGIDAVPPDHGSAASVEEESKPPDWHAERLPQIIRGGLVGEAFSAPAGATAPGIADEASEPGPAREAVAPGPATPVPGQGFGPDGDPEPPAAPTRQPL